MNGIVQTINVSATLKSMDVGSNVFFDSVNENTLRHTAVRLKKVTGGVWSVDKVAQKGFKVTRIA